VFRIYFPTIAIVRETAIAPPPEASRGHGEHVLCVDDEPAIAELLEAMLLALGYRVTAVTSPIEALAAFLAQPDAFEAVVTDLTMPGRNGADLAGRILAERPSIPIVMATGFSRALTDDGARELGVRKLLLKPFSMATLGEALQAALRDARQETG